MARIVIPNADGKTSWFEQVAPQIFSEAEIETCIILHAPEVYPEFHVLSFKLTVDSPSGSAKPDLIFIAKDYSDWWVCEVELGTHPPDHVKKQVQIFTEAKYDQKEAKYICHKNPFLDFDKTLNLFRSVSAKVLVIVNEPKKAWVKPLSEYRAILGVFELFRSEEDYEIFRVNGEYQSRYIKHISKCFIHPSTSRLLGIIAPEELNLPRRGRIKLKYNGCITEWERVDASGQIWLNPTSQSFLNKNFEYEIFQQGDNTLVLRQLEK